MKLTYMFNDNDFNYEPDYSDFMRALKKISGADVYNLSDEDLQDLTDEYLPGLKRRFYDEAWDDFNEQRLYQNNKYAFYGVSRSDF